MEVTPGGVARAESMRIEWNPGAAVQSCNIPTFQLNEEDQSLLPKILSQQKLELPYLHGVHSDHACRL
jgi:hypothetical protein